VVSVNLVVQPPCTLAEPSSSSLAFSGVQGGSNPPSQTLLITVTGNCAWPLLLAAGAPSASWLKISMAGRGNIESSGQSASFTVNANTTGLAAKTYNATFTISATDSAGNAAQGSPQTIAVTLTVLPACTAASVPHSLTFTAAQGSSASTAQNVALSETGSCAFPITWMATGSSSWLSLTPPGQDTGSGSKLSVNVNPSAANLAPGTYIGKITLSATDSNNVSVFGSSQTIKVTLKVTPLYTVSGTVYACALPTSPCSSPVPLPLATLTLSSGATVTADASGNFVFSNVAPGSYTVSVTASGVTYNGSLVVASNATGIILDVYPG
ncbi:MAG TPA: carboxypeptidase-like regulatory domain-containing protein, partial [Ktedonobacteraceae bacterium]|nr:carboxypeptidase-like regulatory domain-containing protein [Ktedonobacteraceae bacterium]